MRYNKGMFILPENTVQLLEYKPEKPKNGKKALIQYQDYIQLKIVSGEISIFSLDRFPSETNCYSFSPKDLYNCINEYATTTKGLQSLFNEKGIARNSFYKLLERYDEIKQLYETAFYRKADSYEDLAIEQLKDDLPEDCWRKTKWGRELSYAGVRLLEHRFNGALKLAAIHNREVYGDKTQIDQRSLNVNLNASINTQSNNTTNIDNDLIQSLFAAYKK